MAGAEHGKSTVVSVRFSLEEYERLRAIAEREKISVSAVVRRSVLAKVPAAGLAGASVVTDSSAGMSFVGTYSMTSGGSAAAVAAPESNLSYARSISSR